MSYPIEYSPAGSVVFCPFPSYGKTNGQSITMTGLAVADVKILKLPSVTPRSSTNGYTLLDTDGIDIGGITGIHGLSIDLADNSDAGFYVVGSWYLVIIASVTIDGETVSLIALKFRIMEAEGAGVPATNLTHVNGTPIPTPAVAGLLPVDLQAVNGDETAAANFEKMLDGTGGVELSATVDGITGLTFPTNFAVMAIDAQGLVKANTKKINDRTIAGAGVPGDLFFTTG